MAVGGQREASAPSRADVARKAGVAPSTVSIVLNGRAGQVRLAPKTVRRVEDAAASLHYVPNAAARTLRRRHSQTIGLLAMPTPNPHVPTFADVVVTTVERARELGFFVLLLPTMPAEPPEILAAVRDAGIAGLVCPSEGVSRSFGDGIARTGIPVVWIAREGPAPARTAGPAIGIDTARGIAQLAAHLRERGAGSLGVIAGPDPEDLRADPRYAGLLDSFVGHVICARARDWSSEAGRRAMNELLGSGPPPHAVFAANDMLAAGAMHACREAGLEIPTDIAIAGFGGFDFGADLSPPLTTVDWPLDRLAGLAVETLIRELTGDRPDRTSSRHLLPTELIRREST